MEKFLPEPLPEIVFASSDSLISRAISKVVKSKKLRKIASRLYTSNMIDKPSEIVKRNCYFILSGLFKGAIISHRSALEGGVLEGEIITLTYKYTKNIILPGLTICLRQGTGPIEGDMPFMNNLFLASRARAFLENMQLSRKRNAISKVLSKHKIEELLETICNIHGVQELRKLRNQARILAGKLSMQKEFKKLNVLISAIVGSHTMSVLDSSVAKARAIGEPYDSARLEQFAVLLAALKAEVLPKISVRKNMAAQTLKNTAFFESYFSNFIEGTKFIVEEAADVIFNEKINFNRPADSHDILSTFRIVSNVFEMRITPKTKNQFRTILKKRHSILMSGRSEKMPGCFKERVNRAGDTVFVKPELVIGTLNKGFEMLQSLNNGLARAIFMMFLVAEIHPFVDGNGRLARVMMNSELVLASEHRIIIPTVYREDYLLTLRLLSRQSQPKPYINMLVRAQEFSSKINFSDFNRALMMLRKCNAFKESYEGHLVMPGKKQTQR